MTTAILMTLEAVRAVAAVTAVLLLARFVLAPTEGRILSVAMAVLTLWASWLALSVVQLVSGARPDVETLRLVGFG
jgi:hypothetical protein